MGPQLRPSKEQLSTEAGFDAHLVKPVDEIDLGKLLFDLGVRKQETRTAR